VAAARLLLSLEITIGGARAEAGARHGATGLPKETLGGGVARSEGGAEDEVEVEGRRCGTAPPLEAEAVEVSLVSMVMAVVAMAAGGQPIPQEEPIRFQGQSKTPRGCLWETRKTAQSDRGARVGRGSGSS